ncbi:MAG: hypothetical protein ABIH04_00965 [Planctomycetota bacterium]
MRSSDNYQANSSEGFTGPDIEQKSGLEGVLSSNTVKAVILGLLLLLAFFAPWYVQQGVSGNTDESSAIWSWDVIDMIKGEGTWPLVMMIMLLPPVGLAVLAAGAATRHFARGVVFGVCSVLCLIPLFGIAGSDAGSLLRSPANINFIISLFFALLYAAMLGASRIRAYRPQSDRAARFAPSILAVIGLILWGILFSDFVENYGEVARAFSFFSEKYSVFITIFLTLFWLTFLMIALSLVIGIASMFTGPASAKFATGLGVVSFVLLCAIIITNFALQFSMASEIGGEGFNAMVFFMGLMTVRLFVMYVAPFILVLMCVSDTWAAALTRRRPSTLRHNTPLVSEK